MRWKDMNGAQKAYTIKVTSLYSVLEHVGRCPKCDVRYRWKGSPKVVDASCIDCGTPLKRSTNRREVTTFRDVDGEWLT